MTGLLSSFDILSGTYYEKRLGKMETLYDVYGTDILQTVEKKMVIIFLLCIVLLIFSHNQTSFQQSK